MPNPIKTSEILRDDNLDALIAKIKELEKTYDALIKKLKQNEKQASALEDTTERLNSTTANGRQGITENARATDVLNSTYKRYQVSINDTNKLIQHYRSEANIANQIKKNEAKMNANLEGSYNRLSAKYSIAKIRLNAMSKAEREATSEGRQLVKRAKQLHDEMKRLQAETGNTALNVGNYKESMVDAWRETGAFGNQLNVVTRVQRTYSAGIAALAALNTKLRSTTLKSAGALKIFRIALISTGIGAIVVVLGTLIAAFASTQRGIDALNSVLIPLKLIFQSLWGAIQDLSTSGFDRLAEAIRNPKKAFEDLGEAIEEKVIAKFKKLALFGTAIADILDGKVKKGLVELSVAAGEVSGFNSLIGAMGGVAKKSKEIIDKGKALGTSIHDLTVQIREEEIAFAFREEKLKNMIASDRSAAQEQTLSSKERSKLLRHALKLNEELEAGQESIAKKRLDLAILETKANDTDAEKRLEVENKRAELLRVQTDAFNRSKEIISMESRMRKRASAEEKSAVIKSMKAAKAEALARINAERDFSGESINEKRQHDIAYFKKEQELTAAILKEKQRLNLITQQELDTALLKQAAAFNKFEDSLKAGMIRQLELNKAEILSKLKAERDFFDESENEKKLRDVKYLVKERELTENILREKRRLNRITQQELDTALNNEEAAFNKSIAAIKKAADDTSEAVIQGYAKINQAKALEALKQSSDNGAQSIYDFFGLDLDPAQETAITNAFNFVKGQLTDFMNFRAQIAAKNVATAGREVSAAENALNREIELQAAGLANTAETRRKELADAKASQEAALKQQEKVQKAQQRIQQAETISNMVVALSKLFRTNPVLAVGLGAVMLAAFASFKVAAANIAKRPFGEGDYQILEGGSHASGNDIPLGTSSNGRQEYAEGGEARMIISKRRTKQYRSVLPEIFKSLKKGTFESEFTRQADAARDLPLIVNTGPSSNVSMRGVETGIGKLIDQGKERTYTDGKGRTVVQRKGITTVYVR